jgi:hypothetical protein
MRSKYPHFNELKNKAKSHLKGNKTTDHNLFNAFVEITIMRDDETPNYARDRVKEIKDMCSAHKPSNPNDSIALNSIRNMSFSDRRKLIELIEFL